MNWKNGDKFRIIIKNNTQAKTEFFNESFTLWKDQVVECIACGYTEKYICVKNDTKVYKIYYKDMKSIVNITKGTYILFGEEGNIKETNKETVYDYLNTGVFCGYDEEYPSH